MKSVIAKSKILIVDDVPSNIKYLAEILKEEYQIILATSGREALETLAINSVDLILLDIVMPEIDGYEVCKRLQSQESTRNIPIIFVTIQNDETKESVGLNLGAVDFITKPVSPTILEARVKTHIALKKLRESLEEQVTIRTEELHSALLEAKSSEHVKSEFISRISHELRTPLNAIIAPTNLLRDHVSSPIGLKQLEQIQRSATDLLNIVGGLLDFSDIASDKPNTNKPFQLKSILHNLKVKWLPLTNDKDLSFNIYSDKIPTPDTYTGDPGRLTQILDQLLDNAFKFTESGKVSLNVVPEKLDDKKIVYRFEVSDTGIGIDSRIINNLLEPFTQKESSSTRKHGGVGIGLAIADRLIKRLGGELKVRSEIDKGSKFYFSASLSIDNNVEVAVDNKVEPIEIIEQLKELSRIVEFGFIDADKFIVSHAHIWKTTPWNNKLNEIVDKTKKYDTDGAIEDINFLINEISQTCV
ncbi:MAG: response regulator [Magnetococcales bacterium]|nr:response regulator [Magnetococcales bacterium]